MTVSLKHKFQSTLPDGVNPSLIRPSNWNDEHDLTLPENTIVGRVESGEGPAKALTQAEVIAFLGDDVGGIDSVEEDPAPKLGGDLDLNGHKIPGIDYDDLTNKPTLGTAAAADTGDFATAAQGALADSAVQPDDLAEVATSGAYSDLSGTPTLGTAASKNTGTSGNTVPLLDGANTWSAAQTFTQNLVLQNTTAPLFQQKNTTSPTAVDAIIGGAQFLGFNASGTQVTYADILSRVGANTANAERGYLEFRTRNGSSGATVRMRAQEGIYHPSATGGDKGNNSINFGGLYKNGVAAATVSDAETLTNKTIDLDDNTVNYTAAGTNAVAREISDRLGDFVSVKDYGAVADGTTEDQDAIQAAINAVYDAGGGTVFIPPGTYAIGLTSETAFTTTGMPATPTDLSKNFGIWVKSGVILEGCGRATKLIRVVDDPLIMVVAPDGNGTQIRNLLVDGNNTDHPITGATYGSGAGVFVESSSSTEDRNTIIDTVWVEDTPGYGIGIEWGNHRGLTLRNIFINGCGSDGIDIKKFVANDFDVYAIVLDNIHIEDFGRTATDGAQTGIDMRGYCTASNIHVRKFGSAARAGIRFRGGISTDIHIGSQRSSLTNFFVERVSGGETTTYGLEVNADDVSSCNGTLIGCSINVGHLLAGTATSSRRIAHTNVKSFSAATYGFRTESTFLEVSFIGCEDNLSPVGFQIEGDRTRLIACTALSSSGTCINIASTADNTVIVAPAYAGTPSTTLADAGTNTTVVSPTSGATRLPNTAFGNLTSLPSTSGGAVTLAIGALNALGFFYYANDANPTIMTAAKSRNATPGSHTVLQSGDAIADYRFEGSDGTNFIRAAAIRVSVDGTPGTTDMPGRMGFYTTPDGSGTPVERVRINSGGSVVLNASGSALATNATAGFAYIPTCAGAPTGTPGSFTGAAAMVYDSTNNQLYIYNGAWKKTAALT